MPFDLLPENLDFDVAFEDTKVHDKRYVVNNATGEYIGIVGDKFNCVSHEEFFSGVHNTMLSNLGEDELSKAKIDWRVARQNAWALMDVTLPDTTHTITTDKHETKVGQRVIALHGVDGSCSNMVFFGAIDFFCTNGMIRGEHDKVRRKNTTFFNMPTFERQLQRSKDDFYFQALRLQVMADTSLKDVNVKTLVESIIKSEKKSDKMLALYHQETSTRGHNVFALYSAFTNYASYADERNGFNLRNTGVDTRAVNMFNREHEVAKWTDTPQFKSLLGEYPHQAERVA